MSKLTELYNQYKTLKLFLDNINKLPGAENVNAPLGQVSDAICEATVCLESAMAYLPIEESGDKKIKLEFIKYNVAFDGLDAQGNIHFDKLSKNSQETYTMIEQLETAMQI